MITPNHNLDQLVQRTWSKVMSGKDASEELEILKSSNKANPEDYFSNEFKIGVYVPVLGPQVLTLVAFVFSYLKSRCCKK